MFTIDFYSKQADLININFKNSYLNKIIQVSKYDFMFYFSKGKNKNIFISLNNIFPFVFFNENKFNLNLDTIFLKSLKKHLLNDKFLGSSLVNEDNILVFDFLKVEDTYDKSNYKLYIELFKLYSPFNVIKSIFNSLTMFSFSVGKLSILLLIIIYLFSFYINFYIRIYIFIKYFPIDITYIFI